MARPTIEQLRVLNPQFTNLWDVTINFPQGVQVNDKDTLNVRAISATTPKANFESQEIKIRGHKVKVAGDIAYEGTLTLTLVEAIDMYSYNIIKQWRELIWKTKEGSGARKSEYQGSLILRRIDRKDNSTPLLTFTVYGVYLEDYTPGDMNENGDVLNIELTFSYDYFEDEVSGVGQ